MNAPETITSPINAAHEVLMRAADNALSVDDVATAAGLKKRDAAKQLKELNGLGLIEAEPRAGGVPFYRLIVAPASNINDMPEVGDTDVVELSRSVEASAPAIAPAIMQAITEDARNEQADEADGWITFEVTADSVSPVPDGTFLKYRMADGSECKDFAENLRWWSAMSSWGDPGADIVAYKIIAKAPADFATTPELQYLAHEDYEMPPADPDFLAQANRALGEQLEAVKAELEIERGRLAACGVVAMCDTPESAKKARDMREEYRSASCDDVARRVDECMALRTERDDLRARLDAVTQQSIADTDALTAQIEHLRAELAERDSHLHKITSDTGRSDIAQRLIDHNDDRLYHEADMLMYEASDAITMLEHERDQLRAELETARAEAIALKTLEGAMPGFGTAHDAQRIASLTAELQTLRTSNANAINEADRLRAELAKASIELVKNVSGYLVCATKRKPRRINDGERAKFAALAAVRAGAARAEVLAVVPVGTARRGAEWRGA